MIQKIAKHIKQGTLGSAVKHVIRRKLGIKHLNRFNVVNQKEAISVLINQTMRWFNTGEKKKVLFVTDQSRVSNMTEVAFSKKNIIFQKTTLDMLDQISSNDVKQIACIVAGFLDPRQLTKLGIKLVKHPLLAEIPFEFSIIPKDSYATFLKYNWHKNTSFVSPILISDIDYFNIYESSLSLFEHHKCDIRDYMDLCQLLQVTLESQIEGDLAEFGSYKGHSGYLIAQVLHKINVKKKLYMFDMFEEFPEEAVGLDAFWNKTHQVDYEEVESKFKSLDNVTLVKGDFTETFSKTDINKLCFVYIDCDSYRGTKYLLNAIYDSHLSENGIIVLEDYGHGPLLGNRVAFHEFFDKRRDCFKFFSQFSGFQIVAKNGNLTGRST